MTDTFVSQLAENGWYPNDANALTQQLEHFFEECQNPPLANIQALILPHAGYKYSGAIAAHGLHHICNKSYDRVIILGPSHHDPLINKGSILRTKFYQTPLGQIPLDTDFIEALLNTPYFDSIPDIHEKEHSVQMEVPLIQLTLPDAAIVPIVVGSLHPDTIDAMAFELQSRIGPETLVIVSSDFTHYGANFSYVPFKDNIQENIKKIDMTAVNHIKNKDKLGFGKFLESEQPTICGSYPLQVLVAMLSSSSEGYLIDYSTSAQQLGDWSHSVSYVAMIFCGLWQESIPYVTPTP